MASLLFLHNNLRVPHHKRPDIPWYHIPVYIVGTESFWSISMVDWSIMATGKLRVVFC
jgi:fatty acid desaturase